MKKYKKLKIELVYFDKDAVLSSGGFGIDDNLQSAKTDINDKV